MKHGIAGLALSALVSLSGRSARAGMLGTTPIPVTCGMTIQVSATNSGQTLTLASSDPILSAPCPSSGLTIINKGHNALSQSFTIDCQTNQANPIKGTTGIGIMLQGLNLAAFNCYVDGFNIGVASNGDGVDIEDSQVQNASSDGFFVKSHTKITNQNIVGITFTGNRAFGNGGWGFNMPANEISGGTGSFFNNIADTNGKGGFLIKGDGNFLSGSEAFNNGGPGFFIISKSCCSGSSGQTFDTAAASSNIGLGIVYEARDDGSNCVGGTGPTCTGGTFYPTGFDTTPGGISAANNGGTCPPGSLPFLNADGVCPIVLKRPCSQAELGRCP